MTTLRVDLQEGFDGEPVVIKVDGEELYRSTPATRMQTGFADRVEVDVDHSVELEIELPEHDLRASIHIDPQESPFVGVSLADGQIRTSFEELGYL